MHGAIELQDMVGKTRLKEKRDKPKVTEFDNEFFDLTQKSAVHKRKH